MNLGQQDSVGHQLYRRLLRHLISKANLETNRLTNLAVQLTRNPRRHTARGNPPGLGMSNKALDATTSLKTNLRQLRGLTRPGLATHDDHLMRLKRRQDGLTPLHHRQIRRITNLQSGRTTITG